MKLRKTFGGHTLFSHLLLFALATHFLNNFPNPYFPLYFFAGQNNLKPTTKRLKVTFCCPFAAVFFWKKKKTATVPCSARALGEELKGHIDTCEEGVHRGIFVLAASKTQRKSPERPRKTKQKQENPRKILEKHHNQGFQLGSRVVTGGF